VILKRRIYIFSSLVKHDEVLLSLRQMGKWSELRKSERRKPKRTPKIDFRRSDLL
jgi:hypothetical protein